MIDRSRCSPSSDFEPDEQRLSSLPLSTVLDRAIRCMWPRRTARELLLDLGERKRWSEADHQGAVARAAAWLRDELLLPATLDVLPPAAPLDTDRARAIGEALVVDTCPGIARWATGLAPALGTTGKTLANTTSRGLRADRTDHRRARGLARLQHGQHPPVQARHVPAPAPGPPAR